MTQREFPFSSIRHIDKEMHETPEEEKERFIKIVNENKVIIASHQSDNEKLKIKIQELTKAQIFNFLS